jgi:iron complex transport system substrate-binding protein
VVEEGFRADLLVDNRAIVEIKSVERLLINFGAATLREGLHRIVNGLLPSASPRLRVNQSTGP